MKGWRSDETKDSFREPPKGAVSFFFAEGSRPRELQLEPIRDGDWSEEKGAFLSTEAIPDQALSGVTDPQ